MRIRLVVFLSVVLSVSALLHGYAWLRMASDPAWPEPFATLLSALFAAAVVGLPFAMLSGRVLPHRVATPLAWTGFLWLGALFYLDVTLLALDALRMAAGTVAYAAIPGGVSDAHGGARLFAGSALAISLGFVGFGVWRGLGRPRIVRVDIPIANLAPSMDGFRIAQLTDVHVGPTIGAKFVERLVDDVNAEAVDMVAITGDLVDGPVAELAHGVAPLAGLRAKHGSYFVTGNHEYFSGADAWSAKVRSLGIRVLRNEHVTLRDDSGGVLVVAGIDDALAPRFGGASDVPTALRGREDERAPVVLLAHQPRSIEGARAAGVAVQLSGHTHGGQMQPFGALVRVEQPVLKGLHRFGDTMLYVSEGTGYWGPPLRVGTRAEITIITLRRA